MRVTLSGSASAGTRVQNHSPDRNALRVLTTTEGQGAPNVPHRWCAASPGIWPVEGKQEWLGTVVGGQGRRSLHGQGHVCTSSRDCVLQDMPYRRRRVARKPPGPAHCFFWTSVFCVPCPPSTATTHPAPPDRGPPHQMDALLGDLTLCCVRVTGCLLRGGARSCGVRRTSTRFLFDFFALSPPGQHTTPREGLD